MRVWLSIFLFAFPAAGQVSVLTYHNDLARTAQNLNETILTPANVNSRQFGKLFTYAVDGYVYGQPLYMPGLNVPGKGLHNVVFVVTEHDSVYAFDADSNDGPNASPLWHVSFLSAGVTTVPAQNTNCNQIVPEIGITSTPVIDPATGTIYVVAMTLETSGFVQTYVHRLHALDITTGAERPGSPVTIQASVPGTGERGSTVTFNARAYKQRPGLLLLNGVVYTAWSSHCDIGTYHGWLIGYDAKTLQQVAVYNNTADGNQGSFWASGAAPAVDAGGNIYLIAGNGTFDADRGGSDLGDAFIKLSTGNGLAVADYFAPFNVISLNDRDLDVGSSGAVLLPDSVGSASHPHLLVSAGKEGRIYLLDRDNMGHFQAGSDSQIVQSLPGAITALFGIPAYFNNTVYFSGAGDHLKAFSIANGQFSAGPVSQSSAIFGSFGATPTVSANGSANGILWAIDPAARLRAYDASNLASELYNSSTNARDALGSYVKFSSPTIVNGKVYVGTQNSLAVFGLLAGGSTVGAVVNAAGFQPGPVAPGSIVSVFGTNLAPAATYASQTPLPPALGGVSLTINGRTAPLFYAGPTQINAQIPYETVTGAANAIVTVGNNALPGVALTIQPAAPGIFTGDENRAAAQNEDLSPNGPDRPASPGSVLTVYLTGQGALDAVVGTGAVAPLNPLAHPILRTTATLGGQDAEVSFAGMTPGLVGLFQVNLRIPQLPPGDYQLTITTGNFTSNTAIISVGL